jgi:hypothetical protein
VRLPKLALLLAFAACGAPQRRTSYVLTQHEDLVISNRPMVTDRPAPTQRDGRIDVPYVLLVLNQGRASTTLATADVSAAMDYLPVEVRCHRVIDRWSQQELPIELAPGMETRIECLLRLSPEATRLAALGDRLVELRLWKGAGGELVFTYFLPVGTSR